MLILNIQFFALAIVRGKKIEFEFEISIYYLLFPLIQEEEFHRGPATKTLESLISINNKLQQPDAAAGVLVYAKKHMQHQGGDFVSVRMFDYIYRIQFTCMCHSKQVNIFTYKIILFY